MDFVQPIHPTFLVRPRFFAAATRTRRGTFPNFVWHVEMLPWD